MSGSVTLNQGIALLHPARCEIMRQLKSIVSGSVLESHIL